MMDGFQSCEFETVDQIVDFYAEDRPEVLAIAEGDEAISYHALQKRSAAAFDFLKIQGLVAGDRLVAFSKTNTAFFSLVFACARLGVCLVPLNWRLSESEINDQLASVNPKLIFSEEEFLHFVRNYPDQVVHWSDFAGHAFQVSHIDQWHEMTSDIPDRASMPLLMMFTSGTTGQGKGVVINHKIWLDARTVDRRLGSWNHWAPGESALVSAPLFHVAGLGWAFMALYNGGACVLVERFCPKAIFAAIDRWQPDRILLIPVMLVMLMEDPGFQRMDWSSIRIIAYGAAPMPPALFKTAQRIFNSASFLQFYGMTETIASATFLSPDDHHLTASKGSVGRALPGVQLEIRDEDGQVLEVGQIGEIWVKAPSIMKEYWQRPEETARAIVDGWYRTGDGGYLNGEGYLFLKDRIKDMVITGGENVYPSEVENLMSEFPGVREAAVFGVPHPKWGEEVTGAISIKSDQELDVTELQGFLREQLAGYKCPHQIHVVPALPRNPSGKVLKNALRDMFR